MSHSEHSITPPPLRLTETDHEVVFGLMRRCEDYFLLQDGVPPTQDDARELFVDLPEGKDPADQFVLGYGRGAEIDGLVAVLSGYPRHRDWYVGLILVDPASRGRRIGQHLYQQCEELALQSEASRMLAAVIEPNRLARKFWQGLGFTEARLCPEIGFKRLRHRRVEFERKLAPGGDSLVSL